MWPLILLGLLLLWGRHQVQGALASPAGGVVVDAAGVVVDAGVAHVIDTVGDVVTQTPITITPQAPAVTITPAPAPYVAPPVVIAHPAPAAAVPSSPGTATFAGRVDPRTWQFQVELIEAGPTAPPSNPATIDWTATGMPALGRYVHVQASRAHPLNSAFWTARRWWYA